MDIRITPRPLRGEINAITSKSAAHRLLICAALADSDNEKETELVIDNLSEDIEATINCLRAMGAVITSKENTGTFTIKPVKISEIIKNTLIDCGESGSTLRFLLPLAVAANRNITVTGSGTLLKRPMKELINVLEQAGAEFTSHNLPYTVGGGLKSGVYELPGNVSSGYISGMMFVLPMLSGDSEIVLLSPPQSTGYIEMTLNALKLFGIETERNSNGWSIKGNQTYKSPSFAETEKDWSNAAFFLAAGALGTEGLTVKGLDMNSAQGDKRIVDLLRGFGAGVDVSENVRVTGNVLKGQEIDVSNIPDLLPVLAVLGAKAEGETVLYNAARLRLKESDRLASVAAMLKAFGFSVDEESDRLTIHGQSRKINDSAEIIIDSRSDHRITMSAAVLGSALSTNPQKITIKNAEAAGKSYPAFFEDFKKLGGICDVV